MLRIAVISRYFPSSVEPWQGRSAYETLRVLSRYVNVKVFYPHAVYPSWMKPGNGKDTRLDPSYTVPEVSAAYYGYTAVPVLSRPFNGNMAARAVFSDVRVFSPHLIFSYFLYPEGFAGLTVARKLQIPVVVRAMGSDVNQIRDPISRMRTRRVLRDADFLLTVSENLKEKALALGAPAQKTRALLNGCDHTRFHVRDREAARQALGMNSSAISILYIGRIDVKKGLRELVEAASLVRLQQPNLQVYIVGAGPDVNVVQDRIQQFGASEYIHLRGACAPDDVPLWIASSHLVTLPSYMEGCPNVVLEALACGRPVVATAVGGIPEILNGECGSLTIPRDAGALAQALLTVLQRNPDPMGISRHNSRSWETLALEYLKLFEEIVSRGATI